VQNFLRSLVQLATFNNVFLFRFMCAMEESDLTHLASLGIDLNQNIAEQLDEVSGSIFPNQLTNGVISDLSKVIHVQKEGHLVDPSKITRRAFTEFVLKVVEKKDKNSVYRSDVCRLADLRTLSKLRTNVADGKLSAIETWKAVKNMVPLTTIDMT
jgi:hypothetical protein